jgi:hypothetical protein
VSIDSNISRWVTFLFGPLAIIAGGFIAIKAKAWFNYDLDPAEATAYVLGIVGGIAALVFKWLHNRGRFEIAERLGVNPDQLDTIVNAVLNRLPEAPQTPATTRPQDGAPAAAGAPPATSPPIGGPGGISSGQ